MCTKCICTILLHYIMRCSSVKNSQVSSDNSYVLNNRIPKHTVRDESYLPLDGWHHGVWAEGVHVSSGEPWWTSLHDVLKTHTGLNLESGHRATTYSIKAGPEAHYCKRSHKSVRQVGHLHRDLHIYENDPVCGYCEKNISTTTSGALQTHTHIHKRFASDRTAPFRNLTCYSFASWKGLLLTFWQLPLEPGAESLCLHWFQHRPIYQTWNQSIKS